MTHHHGTWSISADDSSGLIGPVQVPLLCVQCALIIKTLPPTNRPNNASPINTAIGKYEWIDKWLVLFGAAIHHSRFHLRHDQLASVTLLLVVASHTASLHSRRENYFWIYAFNYSDRILQPGMDGKQRDRKVWEIVNYSGIGMWPSMCIFWGHMLTLFSSIQCSQLIALVMQN